MAEPPSLRRAGTLPRDKDGWDVGTVRRANGLLVVRVHREAGDEDWGLMVRSGGQDYRFQSTHADTQVSDGIEGDEGGVFADVVRAAGGSLPKWDG